MQKSASVRNQTGRVQHVSPRAIVKAGWLNKRGECIKNWRPRYFVLTEDGKFLGFRTEPQDLNAMKDGSSDFTITGCQIMVTDKLRPFAFSIRTLQSGSIIERMFSVDSEEERTRWVAAINMVSEKLLTDYTAQDVITIHPLKRCENACSSSPLSSCSDINRKITLEDFQLLKVLGRGGFGKVNLCRDKATQQLVAMKILKKEFIIKTNEVAHTLTESKVLKITNHPFLVGLKYSFQSEDRLFFVMEYAHGGELFTHLGKESVFSESKTRFYGAEITLALAYLHSQGIIYRDLKPENILLDKEGHIKITDFGLCKEGITGGRTAYTFCGTPEYMAPEILEEQPYGRSVDWWATGAVMYEMLCGYLPFFNSDRDILHQIIIREKVKFKDVFSPRAKDLLSKLLTKDPAKRLGAGPGDAEELQDHPFFASINWSDLEKRRIMPPMKPRITHEEDTSYFDLSFAKDDPDLTPLKKSSHLETVPVSSYFTDFSFQDYASSFHEAC